MVLLIHSLTQLVQTVAWGIHRKADGCQQLICRIQGMETFVGVAKRMRKRFERKVKMQTKVTARVAAEGPPRKPGAKCNARFRPRSHQRGVAAFLPPLSPEKLTSPRPQ